MHRRVRTALGSLGLVALGAGGSVLVAGSGSHDSTPLEAVLPLQPLAVADTAALDDGLGHYVVRIDPSEIVADAVNLEREPYRSAGTKKAPGQVPTVDAGELSGLDGRVHHLEGDGTDLVAVLDDGTTLPLAGAPDTAPTVVHPDHPLDALASTPGIERVTPAGGGWYAVTTSLDRDSFSAAATTAGVAQIADDPVLRTASDDEHSPALWALRNNGDRSFAGVVSVEDIDVDGEEARAVQPGTGVIVAVIDSGAITDHPDLGSFWVNEGETSCTNRIDDDGNGYVDDCNGWDFYNGDNSPHDRGVDNNHGSHVSGTIAARADNGIGVAGLAPGVTIMNLKALERGSTRMSTAAEAVRYAVDNGASVINASWGSSGATRDQVAGLEAAIDHALANGVIVVAAAGNDGVDIDRLPTFPASFPQDNVLTVAAARADGTMASFSNHGARDVDLLAPGHYIVSTVDGGYSAMQGTSMAAPHVSAAAAMVIAHRPALGIAGVRSALLTTVDPLPLVSRATVSGGMLNAARALGIDPDTVETPGFRVNVSGLHLAVADEPFDLTVATSLVDADISGGRPLDVRATFLTAVDGVDHGIVGLPVAVDGGLTTTDDHAQVIIHHAVALTDLRAGLRATLGTALPEGTYALVFEVVDPDDADHAYGGAAVVFAEIREAGTPPDPRADPDEPTSPSTTTPTDDPSDTVDPLVPDGPTPPGTDPVRPPGGEPSPSIPVTPGPTTTVPGSPAPTTPAGPGGSPDAPTTTTVPGRGPSPTTTAPDGSPVVTVPHVPVTVPPGTPVPVPGIGGPVTTTPPVSVPDAPDPVTKHGFTLRKISPTWGRPPGGRLMVIHGRDLPSPATVRIGGAVARVLQIHGYNLLVETPALRVGIHDVSVADLDGRTVTLPEAFVVADDKPGLRGPVRPPEVITPGTPVTTTVPADGPTVTTPRPTPSTTTPGPETPVTTPPTPGDGTEPSTTVPTGPGPDGGFGPRPPGVPRLVLDTEALPDTTPALHLVRSGSRLTLPPVDWTARACHRSVCGAVPTR